MSALPPNSSGLHQVAPAHADRLVDHADQLGAENFFDWYIKDAESSPASAREFGGTPGRLLYEIGWDFAAHGLARPDRSLPPDFEQGYTEGVLHFGHKTRRHDRFIRKWLLLRLNAARRGRIVEEGVTPDFLQSIDRDVCPVTRETLTHATQALSDWSIDRLLSSGAYCVGNLAVMSTRANHLKGNLSLAEVAKRSLGELSDGRLTQVEWMRMYTMMLTANEIAGLPNDRPFTPACVWPTPNSFVLPEHALQLAVLIHLPGGPAYQLGRLKSVVPYSAQKSFHKLIMRLRRQVDSRRRVYRSLARTQLAEEPGVQKVFEEFIACAGGLDWIRKHHTLFTSMNMKHITMECPDRAKDFHIDSEGYI